MRQTYKKRLPRFRIARNGSPIELYPLGKAVKTGISFSPAFEQWQAATAAGLDMWKWESGEYPKWFMAKVVAWHRGHVQVNNHTQDALANSVKKK